MRALTATLRDLHEVGHPELPGITFDPTSKLDRRNDPHALVNFRTPRFDLDTDIARRQRREHPAEASLGRIGARGDILTTRHGRAVPGDALHR